nr:substrate-binding domain-containing protein [Clostridia bacterium]
MNKSAVLRYIASAVGVLSAAAVCLSACNKEEAVYYDSSAPDDTVITEPAPEGPDYSRLLMGSTYSALPLSAMTRVALLGESYSEAELYTESGTKDEVLYAFESGALDFVITSEPSEIPENAVVTPVARQALVFYVSASNPVKSLTTEQIREIYTGRHIGWEELGGNKHQITAVQRGAPTAAQEYLELLIGEELSEPPRSVATGLNDIFDFSYGDIGCAV